jgi:aspartyl-tRNA synthetase
MLQWRQRTYCGTLGKSDAGRSVLLMGWVDAIRDHGNVLFIHMRDTSGIVQVVFNPEVNKTAHELSKSLREEFVIQVRGKVSIREKGTENPYIKTGDIEVIAQELQIISRSKVLPFQISEKAMVFGEEIKSSPKNVDEELRLRYRYLDLRRPSVQELLRKRYEIIRQIRECLHQRGFIEIETPYLTKSTPEGARDYLVPSRLHKGKFYALPQSPQLFKQICMIGGIDRYFQVARCFRDEDLRPNRQPEFTQLDLEASFIDEEFIYEVIEEIMCKIFAIGGISLKTPFLRMTYEEAMNRYGTDRPDLRFGMEIVDVTDVVKSTGYSIFRNIVEKGGVVKGFCIKGESHRLSKNLLQNEYAMKIAPSFGAKGMTWMKLLDGQLQSNIVQFFSKAEQEGLKERFKAENGDVLIMVADTSKDLVNEVLGKLRIDFAKRLNLIPEDLYVPVWITDFPLFELKDGEITPKHHPFTMPAKEEFDPRDKDELLTLKARAYDIVVNGEELGGGSIRIHKLDVQKRVFEAIGIDQKTAEQKFGFFLKALEYGAPPHGGIALGLDRTVAMILKTESIRDVIAFPKNRKAVCLLTGAPSEVEKEQLEELGITIEKGVESEVQKQPLKKRQISVEQVRHVARLARLAIEEEELAMFSKDLGDILSYVEQLNELDIKDVPPSTGVLEVKNVWRDDQVLEDQSVMDDIIDQSPEKEGRYFKVPKVIQ